VSDLNEKKTENFNMKKMINLLLLMVCNVGAVETQKSFIKAGLFGGHQTGG
jgi:hypothetical protein